MKQAPQHSIEELRRSVDSLTGELLAVYEELMLLYYLGRRIGPLAEESEIAAVALQEAMDVLSASCGWVTLLEGEKQRIAERCRIGISAETAEHINRMVIDGLLREGKGEYLSHGLKEECSLAEPDVPTRFLATSLNAGQMSRGYVCLGRPPAASIFRSADQKLLNAVAFMTAVELENVRLHRSELEKQRLVSELELARRIQQSLLPQDFSFSDFLDATGVSAPCNEIGGDYFDLIPLGSDLILLVIADVTGKGPPAALQAAMVQGIVHGVSRHCTDPASLISTLNECILNRSIEGKNVTAFLAILDRTGHLRYTNGGHNPPLLIRTKGQVTELKEGGLLLGFSKSAVYAEAEVQLSPGDLLFLYTDGVTDSEDPELNSFGSDRLLTWAAYQGGKTPGEVSQSLMQTIAQFSRASRQADDLTLLAVQYKGSS